MFPTWSSYGGSLQFFSKTVVLNDQIQRVHHHLHGELQILTILKSENKRIEKKKFIFLSSAAEVVDGREVVRYANDFILGQCLRQRMERIKTEQYKECW